MCTWRQYRPYLGARRWQEEHCGVPSSLWLMQKRSSLKRLCTPCCAAPCIGRLQQCVHKPTWRMQHTLESQMGNVCWLADEMRHACTSTGHRQACTEVLL